MQDAEEYDQTSERVHPMVLDEDYVQIEQQIHTQKINIKATDKL